MKIAKKREIVLEKDRILIPINKTNSHWLFLEINKEREEIIIYDSIKQSVNKYDYYFEIMMIFLYYLEKNQGEKREWKRRVDSGFPDQRNNYDCGVFMLKGIHVRSLDQVVRFDQDDMVYFRKLIAVEVIQGNI